jgi:hypothetical protein
MLADLDRCGANDVQLAQFDSWWDEHVAAGDDEFIYHPYDFGKGVLTMQTDRERPEGMLQLYREVRRDGSTELWTHTYQRA